MKKVYSIEDKIKIETKTAFLLLWEPLIGPDVQGFHPTVVAFSTAGWGE